MWEIIVEIFKYIITLLIFHFAIPPLIDGLTMNRWIKIPAVILLALLAAFFMYLIKLVPIYLFFIWILLNQSYLKEIVRPGFAFKINKPLYYISSYLYIILACGLAIFLQMENMHGDLIWKEILFK